MLYSYSKRFRDKYLNQKDKIRLSILSQICSQYFENGDVLPNKVTIKIDLKENMKELHNYRKNYSYRDGSRREVDSYAMSLVLQVLYDLNLEYTSLYVIGKHIFKYTLEISFSQYTIQRFKRA